MSAPIGSTLGIDNWPGRWAEKERALKTVDWSTFRRNSVLMEGIQTGDHRFDLWYERARSLRILPHMFEDSRFGDPIGRMVDGVFATANSLRLACYAASICWEHWSPPTDADVLDIGAGYGGMALALKKRLLGLWEEAYYTIDHRSMWEIQRRFTAGVGAPIADRWSGDLAAGNPDTDMGYVDLVINSNSFGEMDPSDVVSYFKIIDEWLVDGGALYVQNRLERVTNFADYPYGHGWRHVLVRHPFGDKDWVECLSIRDRSAKSPHPAKALE